MDTKFVAAGMTCEEFDDCVEVVLSLARLPPAESEGEFVGMVLLVEVVVTMPIPFAIKSPTPGPLCELELLDRETDELLDRTPLDERADALLDEGIDELLDRKADELLDRRVDELLDRGADELLDIEVDELLDIEVDKLLGSEADELLDRKADELLDVMKVDETVDRVF